MTHRELVELGIRYLKKSGYQYILAEPGYRKELPDVLGFGMQASFLIECKASRSDFLRDKKKPFRQPGAKGLGKKRMYLVNPGICKASEVPDNWMLAYATSEDSIEIVKPYGLDIDVCALNVDRAEEFPDEEVDYKAENRFLYSVIYRLNKGCLYDGKPVGKLEVLNAVYPSWIGRKCSREGWCGFCKKRDACNESDKDNSSIDGVRGQLCIEEYEPDRKLIYSEGGCNGKSMRQLQEL